MPSPNGLAGAPRPGPVAIFGSGEAATSSRRVHERLFAPLRAPVEVAIVETPAGFQPNVDVVSRKIGDYLEHHLQNHKPRVAFVRARRRGTDDDPDSPDVAAPLRTARYIVAGPGSPTYAIRHLRDTLTWRLRQERHDEGATIALASAAALAFSAHTLPVYEIYKAGEDIGWVPGLDLFGRHGLELAIIPHWNNREGGKDLDTSHCFMGAERFQLLLGMLPASATVLGVDEHTSCIVDVAEGRCDVTGAGGVTVIADGVETCHAAGETFPLAELRAGAAKPAAACR